MAPAPKSPDIETYSGRFAANLAALREKRKLTRQEMASAIVKAGYQLSDRTYYAWESGTNSPPFDALPVIAKVLGLTAVGKLFPPG